MSVPVFEVDMEQGADFTVTVNWYGGASFRAPIEEIDPGYPTRIRVTAHGLPTASDTPVIISGGVGAEILNSKDTAIELCKSLTDNHFEVPVSTVASEWVVGTGEITYTTPADITDYTARAQMRTKWHSGTVLHEFTTENGGITLNANDGSIQLDMVAVATALLSFTTAYIDVELIAPAASATIRAVRFKVHFSREFTK